MDEEVEMVHVSYAVLDKKNKGSIFSNGSLGSGMQCFMDMFTTCALEIANHVVLMNSNWFLFPH